MSERSTTPTPSMDATTTSFPPAPPPEAFNESSMTERTHNDSENSFPAIAQGDDDDDDDDDDNNDDDEHPVKQQPLEHVDTTTTSIKKKYLYQSSEGPESLKRATFQVNTLRTVVVLLLVSLTVLICVGVYFYTRNEEKQQYEQEFGDLANRIVESFHNSVQQKLGAINTMAADITAYAVQTKQTFPFVTIPNFAIRGSNLRIQTNAVQLSWLPLVRDDQRSTWELWASYNRDQIETSFVEDNAFRSKQDEDFGYDPATVSDGTNNNASSFVQQVSSSTTMTFAQDGSGFHSKIWSIGDFYNLGDEPEGVGPYLPLWQQSPVGLDGLSLLNMDYESTVVLVGTTGALIDKQEAILSRAGFATREAVDKSRAVLSAGQYRYEVEEIIGNSHAFIVHPVFDSFEDSKEVVGALAAKIYWSLSFRDMLLPSDMSVMCVLENSYGQTISYQLEGPDVYELGAADLHNVKFNHMEILVEVNSYDTANAGPETRSYTSVPLNQEHGVYKLRIYPAQDPEYSNRPWVYAISLAAVYALTIIVFVIYSIAVEGRHQAVTKVALQHSQL